MQGSSSTCQTTITGIYTLQDYFVPDQTYVSHKTAKPSVLVMEASGSKQAEASGASRLRQVAASRLRQVAASRLRQVAASRLMIITVHVLKSSFW